MEVDATGWSGDGDFTKLLIDAMKALPIAFVKVEDAPATRADAGFSFISNELFVRFDVPVRKVPWAKEERMSLATLHAALAATPNIGEADYSDEGMLQYLRTQRIIPPYQTRGYKLIELVRIYEIGGREGNPKNQA